MVPQTGRVLIALAGFPGSGKSTISAWLASRVNRRMGPGTMLALGMDGFHLPKSELRKMPDPAAALARRGAPWTFDPAGMATRLRLVRDAARQREVAWPGYEHGIGDPVEAAHLIPATIRLIFVEGLYVLMQQDGWQEVFEQFDHHWFLDVPETMALERIAQRHMAAWGMTREQADARIARNDALNAQIVAATRDQAEALLPDRALEE